MQILVALQSREDISKGRSELFPIQGGEDFSHPCVARDVFDVEDHLQILFVLLPPLIERQHGRILECEHGQSAHQGVGQRMLGVPVRGSGMC